MVGDPQPADHREADRVGEQVDLLADQKLCQIWLPLGDQQTQHEQGDGDREHSVAEGDDPVELHPGLVAVSGLTARDLVEAASALFGHPLRYGQGRQNPADR